MSSKVQSGLCYSKKILLSWIQLTSCKERLKKFERDWYINTKSNRMVRIEAKLTNTLNQPSYYRKHSFNTNHKQI